MKLTKIDFYSGAFLSFLLNKGIEPELFEGKNDKNRRIYDFSTNMGNYRVYVKYSEKSSSTSKYEKSHIWNFKFTENQIDELKDIQTIERELYFAFICGHEKLNQSKIMVKLIKHHRNFNLCGTARGVKKNGKDNIIKVSVNNTEELFGLIEGAA